MLNECIIILGANQFQRERALIGFEKAFDGRVITVTPNSPSCDKKFSLLTIQSQESSPDELLKNVVNFIDKTHLNLKAIIPLNDFVLNSGLLVSQHFNLPYNEKNVIENCRNKDKMKKILSDAGLPIISAFRFSDELEAVKIANIIGYPVVVKPLNFGGSGGVKKACNLDELKDAVTETKAHLSRYAKDYDSDLDQMVIESYVLRDREVSVEVINTPEFSQVIGITEKYLGKEPYFSEIAHLVPSVLHRQIDRYKNLEKLALDACRALNIKYGMAHVEIKLSQDGFDPIIMEVGARPAGDGIMDLYEKTAWTNLYKLHCKAYLETLKKTDLPNEFHRTAAIAYLHPKSGDIKNIDYHKLNEMKLPYLDLVTVRATQGQKVETAKNWSTRYGFAEYTFWDGVPEGFDLIGDAKSIAGEIFTIGNADE